MTAHPACLITCDACVPDVRRWVSPEPGALRAHEVRAVAIECNGWRHVVVVLSPQGVSPTLDLCAEHAYMADDQAQLERLVEAKRAAAAPMRRGRK